MDYQGCYRASSRPVRCQEMEYDIGEPQMRTGEPSGYMPQMRTGEPSGYMPQMRTGEQSGYMPGVRTGEPLSYGAGVRMRNTGGYAPGMPNGQPEYDMETQPEYGTCPYRQPYGTNMGEPQNAVEPSGWNRMPYYQMPGYPQTLWQEMESERDMQKWKEMYPDAAKEILPYVEEECDKMEYDGSVMFDEYPDRVMMGKIRNNIYDRVKDRFDLPEDSDRDEMFAMNQETRRRYPPRKNWLGDLVDVMLFQEMHHRRCRRRNCRGWH